MTDGSIKEFKAGFAADAVADLRGRLLRTRWPDQLPDVGWDYGTDRGYLRELCAYWADGFDFDAAAARLNACPQYVTDVDGQQVHFYHVRSADPHATPLLLIHGWPGSVAEFLDLMALLSGSDRSFHLVVPSLPGFAFSGPTSRTGYGPEEMARTFVQLMERLGYSRYGVHGTDWGVIVGTFIAAQRPDRVIGLHLNLMMGSLMTLPPDPADIMKGLTEAERRDVEESLAFRKLESGYQAIQATKPQTLAFGLNDSPAGLAGWIVEKFRTWSDCDGDIERSYTRDQLLLNISLYWFTQTINSSMRIYYEFSGFGRALKLYEPHGTPAPQVTVPTAHAKFPKEVVRPPRSWTTKLYPNMVRWTEMPRGGHFAGMEVPDLVADDLRAFFAGRR